MMWETIEKKIFLSVKSLLRKYAIYLYLIELFAGPC